MKTPKASWGIRPLTERVRGALFNILANEVGESRFLDVFAGTGAVGIEALSRGAQLAIFIENGRQACSIIRENLQLTGLIDQAEIYSLDAVRAVKILSGKGAKFDLIYLGAPYDDPVLEKVLQQIAGSTLLAENGVLVAEHRKQSKLEKEYGRLSETREAKYGETVLAFYKIKRENNGCNLSG